MLVFRMRSAAVVVVGDVGRSPRMVNHALSIANSLHYQVYLIGQVESTINDTVTAHPNIKIVNIPSPPSLQLPELFYLLFRFTWTACILLFTLLFRIGLRLDFVLLQNPPALPAIVIAWMSSRIRGARMIVDWHNYTWTMLVDRWGVETASSIESLPPSLLKKDKRGPRKGKGRGKDKFVEWSCYLEGLFGRFADCNLCVSSCMKADLLSRWSIQSSVLYDRPPSWKFPDVDLDRIHEVLWRLSRDEDELRGEEPSGEGWDEYTCKTIRQSGTVSMRNPRPLILISSTSWTPDEDFSILLDALIHYDQVARISRNSTASSSIPHVVVIITGKGPEKEYYINKINRLRLPSVSFVTPWLESADYPVVVSSADIGVCLHTSTSGLDLPMKIVDMFACGIPVLAKRFAAIGELVEEGKNGLLFDTPTELGDELLRLSTGHPAHNETLSSLRKGVELSRSSFSSWESIWEQCARRSFIDQSDQVFQNIIASN